MNRLVRCFVIVTTTLMTAKAGAGVPSPADSSIPCGFLFVGKIGATADPLGAFEIVVRDLAQNPIPGAEISIVFDDCLRAGDLRVAGVQPDPTTSVVCGPGSVMVRATSGGDGAFRSSLVGGGSGNASGGFNGAPDCTFLRSGGCATVYGDGVNLGMVAVARLDADGENGLGPPDIACWLTDAFASGYLARSDFDFNGTTRAPDLSVLLQAILAGRSQSSAAAFCQ